MHYITCPAPSVLLKNPITDLPLEGPDATKTWGEFIRSLCCDNRVMQGIPLMDLFELRRELAGLSGSVFHPVTDEYWKILADTCSKPQGVFPPVWLFSANEYFGAIINAPTKKPE